ncbi:hypothetical protein NDU88_000261 [Pleurodeles waltl]|uniref:Uncharacterized protein n=1 Tax=Pleurodeles waltl TaxID=8319 RepID=A0AAV7MIC8_PLEWA|nr:hypothetical protein NDU88_000261 [Pleurodeles waltl]
MDRHPVADTQTAQRAGGAHGPARGSGASRSPEPVSPRLRDCSLASSSRRMRCSSPPLNQRSDLIPQRGLRLQRRGERGAREQTPRYRGQAHYHAQLPLHSKPGSSVPRSLRGEGPRRRPRGTAGITTHSYHCIASPGPRCLEASGERGPGADPAVPRAGPLPRTVTTA